MERSDLIGRCVDEEDMCVEVSLRNYWLNCLIKCVLLKLCLVSGIPRLRIDCTTYDRYLLMIVINSVSYDAYGE